MSSIKTTQIDGDVSIGRNTSIGGQASISGSATIGHNLKVKGWLDAPNIKGVVKGVFLSEESLKRAYPRPLDGWLAGVGSSTPFDAYIGYDGEWQPTKGKIDIGADTSYAEEISGMRDDIDDFGKEVEAISHAVDNHTTQLTSHHERLDVLEPELAEKADKTSVQEQSSRIDTLHKASTIHDTQIQGNRISINEVKTSVQAVKDKLDEYPSQFILDLGTVSSQAEGESMAASSEVAGNRNISFIRFQVNGVSALKTTLILQWVNGINETAQIKFVDKAEWRRNVTGATGVAGAATTATQWERTAPHYLGYDATNRKIQLKDYTQAVSRDVQLPLVSPSSAGLFSPGMLSDLEMLIEKARRYADNFEDNPYADSGNISGNAHGGLMTSHDKAKLENYPLYPRDIGEVTAQQNGLMISADKQKLDAYPSNPLNIPLATLSNPGLMAAIDCRNLAETSSLADSNKNSIAALESTSNELAQRVETLESIHAPSDMVEMTIQNDKAQRNVLFWKIEWIDDLEIDGEHINTNGLSGKFYRALSVGEHKVRFRVSAENQTKRGLLGWADDESAGYLSHVTKIVIPEGWTELPANCFESRKHLEEVVLPSTLRVVGGNCFQDLPALRELVIPKNVTTINWSAVNNCAALKNIRMGGAGSMPLTISYEAFRNCAALTCIEILPCQLTFKGSTSPFSNLPKLNALICHLTTEPTFEPSTPFGTIGSGTTERKTLYRPTGVAFYDEGYWQTQLCTTLGFEKTDI